MNTESVNCILVRVGQATCVLINQDQFKKTRNVLKKFDFTVLGIT